MGTLRGVKRLFGTTIVLGGIVGLLVGSALVLLAGWLVIALALRLLGF